MEYSEALRGRRMVRSFATTPIHPGVVDRLLDDALRAPSAGHSRGTAWVVLTGDQTTAYWDAVTTEGWRATSGRFDGLSRAPVVAVALTSPAAYVARYGEPDKRTAGLGPSGGGEGAWPVPYWWGDAGGSVMALLLGAHDAGIAACFLGNFRGEELLCRTLGVPDGWRVYGAVALGLPDGRDHRSPSLDRPGPDRAHRVHHGRWGAGRP